METYFLVVWGLLIAFIAVYNYLYITVVVPALKGIRGNAQIELMPSKQIEDIDEYVRSLESKNSKPWQYYPARYIRAVAAVLALLVISGFLFIRTEVG